MATTLGWGRDRCPRPVRITFGYERARAGRALLPRGRRGAQLQSCGGATLRVPTGPVETDQAARGAVATTLFTRGHRTVGLTSAGAAFLPRARALVAEWQTATEDVRLAGHTLTVGFHSRLGRGLIPTI